MKSVNWFIPLILGFTLFAFCEADRKSYGDSCNKTNRCDSQSSISCIENKCQCLKPNEMIYDESAKKCLILSGEKCSFTLVESQADEFEEKRIKETFECVKNAICDLNDYCLCEPQYYEDTQGNCIEKGTNGDNCTNDAECHSDLMLSCNEGLCSCNQSESVFNGANCVAKAGLSCIEYGRKCVPNAECGYNDQVCTCRPGYDESKDGLCLGIYGMDCDANISPCTQQFSCINAKCDCHYPEHQKYSDGQCVSYVQGPCSEHVNGSVLRFPCVANAECKTQDGISECSCSDGYINSYDRKCYIAHGQPCVRSDSCDPLSDLRCKNGRCACTDLHTYDERRSLCIGLVGAECDLRESFCVTGSTCHSYRFSSGEWLQKQQKNRIISSSGTCRCSELYTANSERICVPKSIEIGSVLVEF